MHFDTQRLLLTKDGLSIRTDQNYHDTFIEKPNIDALTALCIIYRWEVIKDNHFQSTSLRSLMLNMIYYVCCQHEMLFPVGFFIAKQLATDDINEDKLGKAVKFDMDKLPDKLNARYLNMVLPYIDSRPTFIPASLSAVRHKDLFYVGCYFYQSLLKAKITTRKISLLPNVAI